MQSYLSGMEHQNCSACGSKSRHSCGCCGAQICKKCVQFVDDERFIFQPELLNEVPCASYCPSCFDLRVAPVVAAYEATMEKAKEILVYDKSQGKETRLMKTTAAPVHVENCDDRGEALLRLAFRAALAGYNGILDVDLKPEKIRNGSYQTTRWSGTGIPANIDPRKVVKDRSIWSNPN